MANLVIFRESFVNGLRTAVASNLARYCRDEPWVGELGPRSTREMDTSVEVKGALVLDSPSDGKLMDLENAVRLHTALRHLTPLQARDPRLWGRLAHVDFWNYMRKRWPVERYLPKPDKAARFVESRYLIAQSQSRALLRHGIARLWWIGKVSHDPDRANPYELTGVLLSTLDITQQILERGIGRAPGVVMSFLEFLLRNKEELLTGGDKNRSRIRRLAKFLNLHGGVSILDCLSQAEIMVLLDGEYQRIRKSEEAPATEASA